MYFAYTLIRPMKSTINLIKLPKKLIYDTRTYPTE
jgi:hypothetical protein